jgi:DNA-directed RNA polymerase subunit RPC12/RpoP
MKTVKLRAPNAMTPPSTTMQPQVLPAFKGGGSTRYVCAGCEAVLAEGLNPGQMSAMRIQCPKCGTISYFIDVL